MRVGTYQVNPPVISILRGTAQKPPGGIGAIKLRNARTVQEVGTVQYGTALPSAVSHAPIHPSIHPYHPYSQHHPLHAHIYPSTCLRSPPLLSALTQSGRTCEEINHNPPAPPYCIPKLTKVGRYLCTSNPYDFPSLPFGEKDHHAGPESKDPIPNILPCLFQVIRHVSCVRNRPTRTVPQGSYCT